MLTSETTEVLLPCKRHGCRGNLRDVDVRLARALAEYQLARDPTYQVSADCSVCEQPSFYTYSEIINRMPEAWRPQPLPASHGWTLLLIELPAADHLSEHCYFGERLLVKFGFTDSHHWLGILRSMSGMAPSMPLDSGVGGKYLSGTPIVTIWLPEGYSKSVPVEWPEPGTQDIGSFFIPKNAPDTLLAANLFCSNPSCGHIFGDNYSHLKRAWDDHSIVGWFWGAQLFTLTCPKCQTARVVDEECINNLYKL